MAQIGIGAGEGAVTGALAGVSLAGETYGISILVGAIVGAVLGAGVAAAATLLNKPRQSQRYGDDIIVSTNIRNLPVPVAYGRNRLGGNWIAIGNFWRVKDKLNNTPGRRLRLLNGVLALCEGQIQVLGNLRLDGKTLGQWADSENAPIGQMEGSYFDIGAQYGAPHGLQPIDGKVADNRNGFQPPYIPWSNTAIMTCHCSVGTDPRLPTIVVDLVGPDFTVARDGVSNNPNPGDVALYAIYDSYAAAFYYTISSSVLYPGPYGLVKIPREDGPRDHTPPPTGSFGILKAWYLGRHDVLVMQDPVTPTKFYIGYWGIDPDSEDWETHFPKPDGGDLGYEFPMIHWHLDELHGILHSLHDDGTTRYIMRWQLLTGQITRMDLVLPSDIYTAMMYSPDHHRYYIACSTNGLAILDPEDGTLLHTFSPFPATSVCTGLCVSGQMVGVLSDFGCSYYDFHTDTIIGTWGAYDTPDFTEGAIIGNVMAQQNTYTGHVTLVKNHIPGTPADSSAAFCNFMPSIVESIFDIDANGTSGLLSGFFPDPAVDNPNDPGYNTKASLPDFQFNQVVGTQSYPPGSDAISTRADWVRDWSPRYYATWALKSLEGNSSLAAGMWATLTKYELRTFSFTSRWGAGLDPKFFDLGSFESVHSYCVGVVTMTNPGAVASTTRYAERYKLDYALDQEMSTSSFINDVCLVACQGYRTTEGGIFKVGIPRSGMFPMWHFTDDQFAAENGGASTFRMAYIGKSTGINRVRVQYREVLNEYQHNWAEAEDSWDINARGRVQMVSVNADGCGRYGHADLLARAVLDQTTAGRRQVTFRTHFLGWLFSPTDSIAVSNNQCAMSKVPMKIVSLAEQGDGQGLMELQALEHLPTCEAMNGQAISNIIPPGSGDGGPIGWDNCNSITMPLDGSISFIGGGQAFAPGTYKVSYASGAYSPTNDGTWMYAVEGADIVTIDGSGTIVVLIPAPAVSITAPGWPNLEAAVAANAGQTATFTLAALGPIGIRRHGGVVAYEQPDPGGGFATPPVYEVCPPGSF